MKVWYQAEFRGDLVDIKAQPTIICAIRSARTGEWLTGDIDGVVSASLVLAGLRGKNCSAGGERGIVVSNGFIIEPSMA